MLLPRVTMGVRTRTILSSIAALLIGLPIFVAGTWALDQLWPATGSRGLATFLLLAVTVGLIGLARGAVARALARRDPRSFP